MPSTDFLARNGGALLAEAEKGGDSIALFNRLDAMTDDELASALKAADELRISALTMIEVREMNPGIKPGENFVTAEREAELQKDPFYRLLGDLAEAVRNGAGLSEVMAKAGEFRCGECPECKAKAADTGVGTDPLRPTDSERIEAGLRNILADLGLDPANADITVIGI